MERDYAVLFERRCTQQHFWQSGAPLKVQNVQLTRQREERGQLLFPPPTNHSEENTGSHKRNKNREMPAEELVIGGKHCQLILYLEKAMEMCNIAAGI